MNAPKLSRCSWVMVARRYWTSTRDCDGRPTETLQSVFHNEKGRGNGFRTLGQPRLVECLPIVRHLSAALSAMKFRHDNSRRRLRAHRARVAQPVQPGLRLRRAAARPQVPRDQGQFAPALTASRLAAGITPPCRTARRWRRRTIRLSPDRNPTCKLPYLASRPHRRAEVTLASFSVNQPP